jgi:hypothetical protein
VRGVDVLVDQHSDEIAAKTFACHGVTARDNSTEPNDGMRSQADAALDPGATEQMKGEYPLSLRVLIGAGSRTAHGYAVAAGRLANAGHTEPRGRPAADASSAKDPRRAACYRDARFWVATCPASAVRRRKLAIVSSSSMV